MDHDRFRISAGCRDGSRKLVYVLIALGVFGALTVNDVIGYGETAIAEAARPTLGDFFAVDTFQNEPATFVAIIALGLLSVALDAIVRHSHHPTPSTRPPAGRPAASSSA